MEWRDRERRIRARCIRGLLSYQINVFSCVVCTLPKPKRTSRCARRRRAARAQRGTRPRLRAADRGRYVVGADEIARTRRRGLGAGAAERLRHVEAAGGRTWVDQWSGEQEERRRRPSAAIKIPWGKLSCGAARVTYPFNEIMLFADGGIDRAQVLHIELNTTCQHPHQHPRQLGDCLPRTTKSNV